jgi:tetratricopeptide (TPR) repeat protein
LTKLSSIFARGYAALEAEDLDGVQAAVAAAAEANAAEDDPRLRYLDFMSGWLDENTDERVLEASFVGLGELLDNASELEDPAEAARIVLDVVDIVVELGEIDDAEHALRTLMEREDLSPEATAEARLLHAQILMDFQEDAAEALETLDGINPSFHEDPGYVSLRAAVLLDLDRDDEAIELLEQAVERDDDVELRYQLGIILREAGRPQEALEHLLEVLRRDLERHEVKPERPVSGGEAADLRRHLEDVLDTLPEPVLNHVATAAIRVERWPSEEAVRAGCDPRAALSFEGRPAGEQGEDDEGQVDAMVLYRDAIVAQIEDDDEITDVLALGLVEEVDRFFELELFPGV